MDHEKYKINNETKVKILKKFERVCGVIKLIKKMVC